MPHCNIYLNYAALCLNCSVNVLHYAMLQHSLGAHNLHYLIVPIEYILAMDH